MKGLRLLPLMALLSCNPLGTSANGLSTAGVCRTPDGGGVDTYTIFGEWTKVDGYETPRSAIELRDNFDVLIIAEGDQMCEQSVVNRGIKSEINYRAQYFHDPVTKELQIMYADDPEVPVAARYQFKGTCDSTEMILTYSDKRIERYRYRSKDAGATRCDPAQ